MQETVQTLINTIKAVENAPTEVEVDEGAVLVNRLVELNRQASTIKAQQDQVKEEILRYARNHGVQRVAGAALDAHVMNRTDIGLPAKSNDPDGYERMVTVLRPSPLWVSMQDFSPAKLTLLLDKKEGPALRKLLGTIIRDQEQQYVALKQKQEVKRVLQVQEDNTFRRVEANLFGRGCKLLQELDQGRDQGEDVR